MGTWADLRGPCVMSKPKACDHNNPDKTKQNHEKQKQTHLRAHLRHHPVSDAHLLLSLLHLHLVKQALAVRRAQSLNSVRSIPGRLLLLLLLLLVQELLLLVRVQHLLLLL